MSFDYLKCDERDKSGDIYDWNIPEIQEYKNYCENKLINLNKLNGKIGQYHTFGAIELRKNLNKPYVHVVVKCPERGKEIYVKINYDQTFNDLLIAVCNRFNKCPSDYELI